MLFRSGELANSQKSSWINLSYGEFLNILNQINLDTNKNVDAIILNEYIKSISSMVLSLNAFIKEPEKYPSVFTDGSKPKIVKANIKYENEVAQFILENNLETIFQKMYYQIVLNEVVDKMKKANVFLGLERSPIGETHGNAEFRSEERRVGKEC